MNRYIIALNTGSTAGLAGFGFFLLYYFFGVNPIGKISWLSFWVPIPFIIYGIKKTSEEEHEGFISFGQAFRQGILISFVYASLFAMLVYIFGTFIDGTFITDFIDESARNLNENKDAIISLIGEEAFKRNAEEILSLTIAKYARMDFFNKFIFGVFISLLSALFLKKSKPIFDNVDK